jgi:hypothetical protein
MHQSHKTKLGTFHLRQMLGPVLTSAAGAVFGVIPILGWIVWVFGVFGVFVLWIAGLLSAVKGVMRPASILGDHYRRWFAGCVCLTPRSRLEVR